MFKHLFFGMKNYSFILLLLIFSNTALNQPFVYIDAHFVEVMQGAGAWVDYNNDSYPDVFITGNRYSADKQFMYTELYRNKQNGTFTELHTGIPGVYLSALDWTDYDKDGDEDLVLCGEMNNGKLLTAIYRNNRTSFTRMNVNLPAVRDGSVQCGDFDNDGDMDILITGETHNKALLSKVYLNKGNHHFTDAGFSMIPVYYGDAQWADYDKDGDLDILLTGESYNDRFVGKIYKNEGNGKLTETPINITPVKLSAAKWGDFNNDGWIDFIISGETYAGRIVTKIYRNNGKGGFSDTQTILQGAKAGNIDLGDYDHDGDLDIVITGESYERAITIVYQNQGKFVFENIHAGLPGVSMGGAYWGDYDKDGDLDILLLGLDNCFDFNGKLFRNDGVYKKKEEVKETPSSIFTTREMHIERGKFNYFVYASCFCDPFSEGKKDFHAFISNIHYSGRKYELMERFNNIIMNNLITWPSVDAGHRVSVGFKTLKEAEKGRQTVINDYKDEGFILHWVNW